MGSRISAISIPPKTRAPPPVMGPTYHSGETIQFSGIYQVRHAGHRLPHAVTLLKGHPFPTCSKCANAVEFVAVRIIHQLDDVSGQIVLHQLPATDVA